MALLEDTRAPEAPIGVPSMTGPAFPIGEELAIETRLYGTVNGREFDLRGGGMGYPFLGQLSTELRSILGPVHFPMHLMDVPVMMGYPTFSRYQQGTFDLFKISNGYEYERHIRYENGGRSDSVHKVDYLGDKLVGDFRVEAEVDTPDLVGIEPLVETFLPSGPSKVRSHFIISWRKRDGDLFTGMADNEYRLTHNASLPWVQFRHVKFTTDHTQETLRQTDELNVVRDVAQLTASI